LIFYTHYRNAFKPLTLQIFNHGQVAGENVRFEGLVAKREGTVVMDAHPDFPAETYDIPILLNDRTYAPPSTEIYLSDESDYWMIQVEFGNIRPGEKIVAEDQLWFSAVVPMRATMKGKILGENIPEPIQCSLEIKFETLQRPMTIEDVDHARSENEHS